MSSTDTKTISHLAFKILDCIDVYGKASVSTEVINFEDESKSLFIPNLIPNPKKVTLEITAKTAEKENVLNIAKKGDVKKRVVTDCDGWKSVDSNTYDVNNQFKLIENRNALSSIVSRELRNKISSYKSQDTKKNMYNNDEFIDFKFVLDLFQNSQLKCYYCNRQVFVIYDNVREPRQWTIERIDNRLGHNKNNSVMSCLDCNLRRRTMYHERYLITKKLILIKLPE
jgi:hypothetical protein